MTKEITNSISVKICKPEGAELYRDAVQTEKRMKAISEYGDPQFAVLGVPFGGHIEGRDTDGQAFDNTTNIMLRIGDERPVTYYHGFGPDDPHTIQDEPVIIGMAKYTHADDKGHWFDVYLDESEPLAMRIRSSEKGGAKASSGAISQIGRAHV